MNPLVEKRPALRLGIRLLRRTSMGPWGALAFGWDRRGVSPIVADHHFTHSGAPAGKIGDYVTANQHTSQANHDGQNLLHA